MVEIGKVIKADDKHKTVTVEFDRKSACGKCGMCLMAENNMKVELNLSNKVNAVIDDMVEVKMGEGYVLTSALIVYTIPIVLVGLALFITRNLSEIIQLISIGLALILGIIAAVISDRKIRNRKGFCPEIINILEKSKEEKRE